MIWFIIGFITVTVLYLIGGIYHFCQSIEAGSEWLAQQDFDTLEDEARPFKFSKLMEIDHDRRN